MKIFKAYDIRGLYPNQLNKKLALKIGFGFGEILGNSGQVVVGYDMRSHSLPLKDALIDGLRIAGCDVILIGLCSTPMMNFATSFLEATGGVMVTASHNSARWNGFKFCGKKSSPISYDNGLQQIENIVNSVDELPSKKIGQLRQRDISQDYTQCLRDKIKPFNCKPRIVIDYANAMGIKETESLVDYFNIVPLFDQYDGTFPNHEANPLKFSTLVDLQKEVIKSQAAFGVALDGDADRCGFVDELGQIIPMDIITALIAKNILQKQQGAVVYDVRSSKVVAEVIKANGGQPIKTAVGHSNMKKVMLQKQAIFGGELSGHYYFPQFSNCESQAFVILLIGELLVETGQALSQLIKPLLKYAKSEEINFTVEDVNQIMDKVIEQFKQYEIDRTDGFTLSSDLWWFNIRASNTEPLLRLNVEADNNEMLQQLIQKITLIINS